MVKHLVLALFITAAPALAGDMYRCKVAGSTLFSDEPCPDNATESKVIGKTHSDFPAAPMPLTVFVPSSSYSDGPRVGMIAAPGNRLSSMPYQSYAPSFYYGYGPAYWPTPTYRPAHRGHVRRYR